MEDMLLTETKEKRRQMNDNHIPQHSGSNKPDMVAIGTVAAGVLAAIFFVNNRLLPNIIGVVFMALYVIGRKSYRRMVAGRGTMTRAGALIDQWTDHLVFAFIYLAICCRLYYTPMPGVDMPWKWAICALCLVAAVFAHSPQSALTDYYKQLHRWMKNGTGSSHPYRLRRQMERHTPHLQRMLKALESAEAEGRHLPDDLRARFLSGSERLLRIARCLSLPVRSILLSVACLAGHPWAYPLAEVVVLGCVYVYLHKSHEALCDEISNQLNMTREDETGV